jgi:hypothetical protein
MKNILGGLILTTFSISASAQNEDSLLQFEDTYQRLSNNIEMVAQPSSSLLFSKETQLGKMQVIQMNSGDLRRSHIMFKSTATNELISATITMNPDSKTKDFSMVMNFPTGQLIIDNQHVSVLTENNYAQTNLSDYQNGLTMDKHFVSLINNVVNDFSVADFIITVDQINNQKGFLGCVGGVMATVAGGFLVVGGIVGQPFTAGTSTVVAVSGLGVAGGGLAIMDTHCSMF